MKKRHILHWLSSKWASLPLTDKCLLTFMIILMLQSIHNLFLHELVSQGTQSIDTVIRTTAAAIFGYFISGGYTNRPDTNPQDLPNTPVIEHKEPIVPQRKTTVTVKEIISEIVEEIPPEVVEEATPEVVEEITPAPVQENIPPKMETPTHCSYYRRTQQQILIITAIGLFSLLTIIIARNCTDINSTSASTLSQLRDFVSGSVGFLIGHPEKKNKS